jgi:hypothetical protein
MPPENRPTSQKVEKVVEKLAQQGTQGQHWLKIMQAVDAVVAEAHVQNLSDSEKAEVFFYIGSKLHSCSVI